jgi:hypothetical protein
VRRFSLLVCATRRARPGHAVDPKSDAGKHSIPIPEPLYAILKEHVLKVDRGEGLIFGQSPARPYYNAVRERAERVWRRAGLPTLQLHEARRLYKSYLEATETAAAPSASTDRPTTPGRRGSTATAWRC